ncbi:toll/interleukin-1 receptor domain-containing protein [Aeromonas veronii]|uniref:toll/interleukin-1 receptor domain-containing protein n=1 Tax=Aeromonas veronii TaxID=654 RepID=UPI0035B8C0B3
MFISHASEDKAGFVKPLADELIELGVSVWYDEYTLRIGDSLRRSIDKGLAESKYGLIILSKAFFEKNWTQYELNGLVVKEMEGNKVILPIWHNITKDEIMRLSPSLVDKVALNSATLTMREIAEKIADAVKLP